MPIKIMNLYKAWAPNGPDLGSVWVVEHWLLMRLYPQAAGQSVVAGSEVNLKSQHPKDLEWGGT